MRIFMTGATGYIGSAVAALLRARRHDVAALVRPESEAKHLRDRGVVLVAGDLSSLPSLAGSLDEYDAYVHIAQSNTADAPKLNKIALDVFTARRGYLVFTSGVWVLGNTGGRVADESTPVHPIDLVAWRPAQERQTVASGRGAVIRPGCVYGGKQSLLAGWFAAAEQNRPLQIVGNGENRWAMVNLHDLADCYARLVEQRPTGIFHAVDDTDATLNECARAVAPKGAIEHIPLEAARKNLDPFADALAADQRVSSKATRAKLGWLPARTFLSATEEQWREWREAKTLSS